MLERFNNVWPLLIVLAVFVVIIAFIAFFTTRRYDQKYIHYYATFFSMSKRAAFLTACLILNLIIAIFYVFNAAEFDTMGIVEILLISALEVVMSLDVPIIILSVFYAISTIILLWILRTVGEYADIINNDAPIQILKVIFVITVIVFATFISVVEMERIVKLNKYIRRNK